MYFNVLTRYYKRLFARLAKSLEHRWDVLLGSEKKALLTDLKGVVLEIGVGTGANLKYYKKGIRLIGLEPNPAMNTYLEKNAEEIGIKVKIIEGVAENIPLEKSSVDSVVSTHVLCSVKDVEKAISEIKRVLKRNGTFVFIEHVGAKNRLYRAFQNVVNHIWAFFLDGCQADRDLEDSLRVKFKEISVKRKYVKAPTRIIAPHIFGIARK